MDPLTDATVPEFLRRLDAAWADLEADLAGYTAHQMTVPTDAAGWTVKDHAAHLVVWLDGMNAVLTGQPRLPRMGLDDATWQSGDGDAINEAIRRRHRDRPLADVLADLRRVHAEFRGRVAAMADADLVRPYADFQPGSPIADPILGRLVGNSFEHYAEHRPWMRAIAEMA